MAGKCANAQSTTREWCRWWFSRGGFGFLSVFVTFVAGAVAAVVGAWFGFVLALHHCLLELIFAVYLLAMCQFDIAWNMTEREFY